MYRKLVLLAASFLWLVSGGSASAESASEDLPKGATLPEVMKLWGHPVEKIERQVKHEVVWTYSQGAFVVFKDGRVINWKSVRGRGPNSEAAGGGRCPGGCACSLIHFRHQRQ